MKDTLSTMCTNGEKVSSNEVGRSNQILDVDQYMNIDEFIQALNETELITPFGRLQSNANVNQDDYKTVESFSHQLKQSNYGGPKREYIPLTSTVLQVIETERNLRDIDTKTSNLPPQHTKEIMEDSALKNYRVRLLSDKEKSN